MKVTDAELTMLSGHVALGARHILEQEDRIVEMRRRGQDLSEAVRLLQLFRGMFALHQAHLNRRLGREIDDARQ